MHLTPAARAWIFTFYSRFSNLEPSKKFKFGFTKLCFITDQKKIVSPFPRYENIKKMDISHQKRIIFHG